MAYESDLALRLEDECGGSLFLQSVMLRRVE